MALLKQITQSQLLYFSHYQDAITVSENSHFRWLAFGDIVQSLMNKRMPHRLTLPHQAIMLFPLLHFTPSSLVEFGLGGGNIARFLAQYAPAIEHKIIENNSQVIECFTRYFQPTSAHADIVHQDALQWLLAQEQLTAQWVIYDIYQHQQINSPLLPYTLLNIIEKLGDDSCVSINIPIMTKSECEQLISLLWQHINQHPTHYLQIFDVPHYQNTVIHIMPLMGKSITTSFKPTLPNYIIKRWQACWNNGITVLPNNEDNIAIKQ